LDAANDIGKYPSFKARGEITRFKGKTLYYNISFLWFDNAAPAKVQFLKEKGVNNIPDNHSFHDILTAFHNVRNSA
jgi:hypothetical protein